jgi:L,D-peptidoglycan transpeptidase YkuD (ErfK/YbiS/YcfS/YnhG family)
MARLPIFVVIAIAVTVGCETAPPPPQATWRQMIVVQAIPGDYHATLIALERNGGSWDRVFECPATIGKNGLAIADDKREGDGKTPDGIYKLKRAFGYAATVTTGLDYRPVTDDDLWIDDPESPDYNRPVKRPTTAKSFEVLKRKDDLYEFAVVIEYNTDPVKTGAGSAIFLHVWGGPDSPTAGCVSVDRDKMIQLLKWLDAKKLPKIQIGFKDLKLAQ